jgi:hypothetical protein
MTSNRRGSLRGLVQAIAVGAALALGVPGHALGQAPDFEKVGRELLSARGLDPATASLDELFSAGFARFELGAFELLYPQSALADPAAGERFRRAARALLAIQTTWLDTVDPAGERVARKDVDADQKRIDKWIAAWKPAELAGVAAGSELGTALPSKDKDLAALMRFNGALRGAGLPQQGDAAPARARLILLPDRKAFVSLCAAVGLVREDQRENYWVAGMPDWVEFRFDETRVVALEFADLDPATWEGGLPMDLRNDRGLEEQIAQLAFGSLVLARFGNRIDPDFSIALCNNLVVDAFGEVDTRTDGDLRPRTAPPRSVFIPGGMSQGGLLPPNDADSPWRSTRGADRFLAVLHAAQQRGAKEAGDKKAVDRFLLLSEDTAQRFVAGAPFFGPAAADTAVPAATFGGDWLELQRTYRIAFCYWLREGGAGKAKDSNAAFAQLLARLAPEGEVDFAAAIEEAYGLPVSSAHPGAGDLEGRFLAWLTKQG